MARDLVLTRRREQIEQIEHIEHIEYMEPDDQFYGDRVYRCADHEGHHWTFAMHVRDVSRADAEVAIGQPIHATNWA